MKTTPEQRQAMRNTAAAYPGTLGSITALLDDFDAISDELAALRATLATPEESRRMFEEGEARIRADERERIAAAIEDAHQPGTYPHKMAQAIRANSTLNGNPLDAGWHERAVAAARADERARRDALWTLLDDIDTADDVAKDDHAIYRRIVRDLAERRHAIVEAPKVNTDTTVFPAAPGAERNYNVAPGTDPTRN